MVIGEAQNPGPSAREGDSVDGSIDIFPDDEAEISGDELDTERYNVVGGELLYAEASAPEPADEPATGAEGTGDEADEAEAEISNNELETEQYNVVKALVEASAPELAAELAAEGPRLSLSELERRGAGQRDCKLLCTRGRRRKLSEEVQQAPLGIEFKATGRLKKSPFQFKAHSKRKSFKDIRKDSEILVLSVKYREDREPNPPRAVPGQPGLCLSLGWNHWFIPLEPGLKYYDKYNNRGDSGRYLGNDSLTDHEGDGVKLLRIFGAPFVDEEASRNELRKLLLQWCEESEEMRLDQTTIPKEAVQKLRQRMRQATKQGPVQKLVQKTKKKYGTTDGKKDGTTKGKKDGTTDKNKTVRQTKTKTVRQTAQKGKPKRNARAASSSGSSSSSSSSDSSSSSSDSDSSSS